MPDEIIATRRKYREEERVYLKERTEELLKVGILRREVTSYSSPWLCVPKKDGTIRDVIDMRRIKRYMRNSACPVSTVEEVIQQLGPYNWFEEIYLKSAILQLEMTEEDAEKCAVDNGSEILLKCRLAMGGKDSSAQLEHEMEEK